MLRETKLIYCALQSPNRACSSQCNTEHAAVNAIHLAPVVQRVHNTVNLLNNWVLAGKYCSNKNDIFISYYIPGVLGYFSCVSMTCDMMSSTLISWQPTCVFNTIHCRFLNWIFAHLQLKIMSLLKPIRLRSFAGRRVVKLVDVTGNLPKSRLQFVQFVTQRSWHLPFAFLARFSFSFAGHSLDFI